jgi:hypothetical protein
VDRERIRGVDLPAVEKRLLDGLAIGALDGGFALLFLGVAIGYGTILSVWAVVLEEVSFKRYPRRSDFWLLIGFALIEGLGYRQLTVLYRLEGFWRQLRGVDSWGKMPREGFGVQKPG